MADYTKLSELVGSEFTIQKVWGYKFKKWNPDTRKMEVADAWERDYQKKWEVDTDKGKLDLSANQMAILLEAVMRGGVADVNDATFAVKSNGKTDKEIRYWFNVVKQKAVPTTHEKPSDDPDDYDMSKIPF